MKIKTIFLAILLVFTCFLFGCSNNLSEVINGENGVTPKLRINDTTSYWEVSYDNGTTWESLFVRAIGRDGDMPSLRISEDNEWEISYNDGTSWESLGVKATGIDGINGNTPKLRVNENNFWEISYNNGYSWEQLNVVATGSDGVSPKIRINNDYWEVSYDSGVNWESLGVVAVGTNGTAGEDGENGTDGVTPKLRINNTSNYWEVSYDSGETWSSLGVIATGSNGTNGKDGTSGKDGTNGTNGTDGITPKLRINDTTSYWEVSYDNGSTWESLEVLAVSKTYVPAIFYNYDGTKLYEFYYEYGSTISYDGPAPTRESVRDDKMILTTYTFTNWDKSLENITVPTIFTAQYKEESYLAYKVTFLDSNNDLLYEDYYRKTSDALNVVYPLEQPFSYDETNVYQFAGWSSSLYNLTGDITVNATYKTVSRTDNGEYPQTVVTDQALITALNAIEEKDDNGYVTYQGEKYYAYDGGAYTDQNGNEISAGLHYYKVEPIRWRHLETKNGNFLVISQYIIDYQPFLAEAYGDKKSHTSLDGNTASVYSNNYEYSDIRKFLNTEFMNRAFASTDGIATTSVYNGDTAKENYASNTTYDKVFLLSASMFNSSFYFDNTDLHKDRKATSTDYAMAVLTKTTSENDVKNLVNSYHTRTAFETSSMHNQIVGSGGNFILYYHVGFSRGVRPAINFIDSTK